MSRPRLLDLFCGAGGCSVGYERAGFEVTGVDHRPQRHHRGGTFVQADAFEYVAQHGHEYDAIHASPPCQAHSSLRALQPGKTYIDLIPETRAALQATGKPYVIENVMGAPLGGGDSYLLLLCGTMFGLVTPDGRAEIRRHRLFECSWCFGLRPACQHGAAPRTMPHMAAHGQPGLSHARREALTVTGNSSHGASYTRARKVICVGGGKAMSGGMMTPQGELKRRRAMSVTGNTQQTNTVRNTERETFSVDDARAAMGIDWMPMKALSQAIPPAYTEWIGRRLLEVLA